MSEIMICGDANKNGNISLTYKGGCKKLLNIKDAYRCVGCGGYFHKECIIKHFKQEKEHDYGRHEERKEIAQDHYIVPKKGLEERLFKYFMAWKSFEGIPAKRLRQHGETIIQTVLADEDA